MCRSAVERFTRRGPANRHDERACAFSPAARRPLPARSVAIGVVSILNAGCDGVQSALNPQSPAASVIARLWWVMCAVAAGVFVLVMVMVVLAVVRGRRADTGLPLTPRQSWSLVLVGGVILPLVVIVPLVVASARISRSLTSPPPAGSLLIEVIGHQWWWEVNYLDDGVRSPNELHLPVGRPVHLLLRSADVIHSFWVPALAGKIDLVPGQVNRLTFTPSESGVFRGQCAEFCGGPHALMAFEVVVEPPARFEAWLRARQAPPDVPAAPELARGQAVFLASGCGDCHRIAGTAADGNLGPDLTHLASRRRIAAATLPNTIGHLGGWILDPQSNKPGAKMPPTPLAPDDFMALLAYLQSLR